MLNSLAVPMPQYSFQDAVAGVPLVREVVVELRSEQEAHAALLHSIRVSIGLELDCRSLLRCMKSASRKGFDPRNSHDVQSRCFAKAWADKARRIK